MIDLQYLPAQRDGRPACLLALPPRPATRLVVCVHGFTRQPLEQAEAFAPLARERGWALLLPVFDERNHPSYAQLRRPRRGPRPDKGLIAVVEALAVTHGLPRDGWCLFGYSAGAQFAHRFALRYAGRLGALALGAAGWYTWPDPARPWPQGLHGAQRRLGPLDLDAFLRLPTALWVGDRDDRVDRHLRDDEALNEWQGPNRRVRAERWCEALGGAAAAQGIERRPALHTIARAGHSFVACQRRGQLAQAVTAFFAEATSASACPPAVTG
jgi:pimeloyl-ACP methyl ester carboxylesterase